MANNDRENMTIWVKNLQIVQLINSYALLNLSGQYQFNKNFTFTVGVDNLFDKRLFRKGNSSSLKNPQNGVISVRGAGAATYNEPGRTLFINTNVSF